MKIGIDCRMFSTSFTGIGRYTYELVENLQRLSREGYKSCEGHKSASGEIFANPSNAAHTAAQPHEYVLFFNEPEFSNYEPKEPNFKKVLVNAKHYSIREQTTFLKALNKEKLDMMHFTHFNAPILYRKPFVVTIHDLTHTLFPGRKMTGFPYRFAYKLVMKNAVKKAKRIIAISQNTKNDLVKMLHANPEKIDVIYEGVNSEFHQLAADEKQAVSKYLSEKYGIDKPFLLYTGVHRYHKNLPRLIEAFAKIAAATSAHNANQQHDTNQQHAQHDAKSHDQQHYAPLSLVITGKEDPLYPEAENLTKSLKLEDKVIFTGLISEKDIVALYNLAEAYVFPSLYEGFGLPVLEAMACGTPVCASNVSSIPEVAGSKNGVPNAVLFDPYNVDDIVSKISHLIADKDLRETLMKRGLSRIRDFSWEKMAKEILNAYTSALATAQLATAKKAAKPQSLAKTIKPQNHAKK